MEWNRMNVARELDRNAAVLWKKSTLALHMAQQSFGMGECMLRMQKLTTVLLINHNKFLNYKFYEAYCM